MRVGYRQAAGPRRILYRPGQCLQSLGLYEEAVEPFEHAVALKPDDASVRAMLGTALDNAGFPDQARAELDQALRLDSSLSNALLARASISQRLGDFKSALADLDAFLSREPGSAEALVLRGCCHLVAGQLDQAQDDFAHAVRLKPAQETRIKRLITGL